MDDHQPEAASTGGDGAVITDDDSELERVRTDLRRLVDEQTALRRVATLVAKRAPPSDLFAAVAGEVARVLDVSLVSIVRTTEGGIATQVGAWGEQNPFPIGTSWTLDEHGVSGRVWRTRQPARVDYTQVPGEIATRLARVAGIRFAVGVPIIVDGAVWGAMMALSTSAALPSETERRLTEFTELVATAISNTQVSDDLAQLAEEQGALRRVAMLVASGAAPSAIVDAVCEETGRLMNATSVNLARFTADGFNETVAGWSIRHSHVPTGTRLPLEGDTINVIVQRTGAPTRVEGYDGVEGELAALLRELGVRCEVGAPVIVDGSTWGALIAGWDTAEAPPAGLEARLARFAELIATAIARANASAALDQLAREQAALRAIATLVARRGTPAEVFTAVAEEVGRVLDVEVADLWRYDEGSITYLASWSRDTPIGFPERATLEGASVARLVWETGQPSRIDDWREACERDPGQIARHMVASGIRSTIGCPVIVDGSVWGVMAACTIKAATFPAQSEWRLASFTELIATAISNASTYSKLVASRARIVAASDEARRRIERDLHDGTQQQLVSLALQVREIQPRMADDDRASLDVIVDGLESILDDVRTISQGLHPSLLSRAGLAPALRSLRRRSAVPVKLDVALDARFPPSVEIAAYYAVSEALANAAKHAQASTVSVRAVDANGWLEIVVQDDGVGGATLDGGSGLMGLVDRVEALGGRVGLESSVGDGTTLTIALPTAPAGAADLE